jgi:hypothetical protein
MGYMAKYVGLPYTKGSATSKAAAESMVEPSKNQRQQAWEFIADRGAYGATSDDLKQYLGFHHSSTTRLTELVRLGRVERTDDTRPTKSNRQAKVHIAIPPDDWKDKRPGWPTPTKEQRESEVQKWKRRAYRAAELLKEEKRKNVELQEQNALLYRVCRGLDDE